jgi:hypothetical protein
VVRNGLGHFHQTPTLVETHEVTQVLQQGAVAFLVSHNVFVAGGKTYGTQGFDGGVLQQVVVLEQHETVVVAQVLGQRGLAC